MQSILSNYKDEIIEEVSEIIVFIIINHGVVCQTSSHFGEAAFLHASEPTVVYNRSLLLEKVYRMHLFLYF